jgi:hypothetical protein
MSFAEYKEYDAVGLAALVARNEVTPLELVDAAIGLAEELNPRLNAIVYRTFERTREHAKDRLLPDGPFKGVPFLLKDALGGTTEAPTRAGSRFTTDKPAPYARPMCRNLACCRSPSQSSMGRRATRGIFRTRRAGRAAARPPQSLLASCRLPMPTTAAGRFGSRHRAVASSA